MSAGGYSYLTRSLAQGSKPPVGVRLPFDTIVLAAREYQPRMPGFEVVHVPLVDDEPTPSDRKRIHAAAQAVAQRLRAGRRVLVTCRMGKNRSGVIAGLALVELGMPGKVAARRIQHLRDGLTNPFYLQMVIGS